MTLNEQAFEKAWAVWLDATDVKQMDRDSALKHAITAYLAALPTARKELVERDAKCACGLPMSECGGQLGVKCYPAATLAGQAQPEKETE
jgi:hypothetical protein